jgi:hypothetical protein
MKTRKLNNQEADVLAVLLAAAVVDALEKTSAIADLMKVDCQTVRAVFAEAVENIMDGHSTKEV